MVHENDEGMTTIEKFIRKRPELEELLIQEGMIKNLKKQIDIQDIGIKVIEAGKVRGGFVLKTAERKDGAVEKLESEIRVIGEENGIRIEDLKGRRQL